MVINTSTKSILYSFSKYKVVLFDFDGTLVSTIELAYNVYCEFLSFNLAKPSKQEFDFLNGKSIHEIANHFIKVHKINLNQDQIVESYKRLLNETYATHAVLNPGVVDMLTELKNHGCRLGVVSAANEALIHRVLSKYNILNNFEHIITPKNNLKGKPSPDLYLEAIKVFNVKHTNILVIEDSDAGISAARAANLEVLHYGGEPFYVHNHRFFSSLNVIKISENYLVNSQGVVACHEPTIDAYWSKYQAENQGELTRNDLIFCLDNTTDKYASGYFYEYKQYLASKSTPNELSSLTALSVSAVLCLSDGLLMGKRSNQVNTYKEYFELVPSGGISQTALKNSTVDYLSQIHLELIEETSININNVVHSEPILLIHDTTNSYVDLCILINVNMSWNDFTKLKSPRVEYTDFYCLHKEDITKFIIENNHNTVPTTLALLKYWSDHKNG